MQLGRVASGLLQINRIAYCADGLSGTVEEIEKLARQAAEASKGRTGIRLGFRPHWAIVFRDRDGRRIGQARRFQTEDVRRPEQRCGASRQSRQ